MLDKLLIWQFNRGSRDVLRLIYEKYKDDLVTLASALLLDKAAAQDTVHDVFVSFLQSAQKFRLTGSLKGYLATCVANTARNRNKASIVRQGIALHETLRPAPDSSCPQSNAILDEQLSRLSWALSQLPYEQREVLVMHHYSGLKFKAIAQLEGVSINTVQGRYRYGLDKLRTLLNGQVKK